MSYYYSNYYGGPGCGYGCGYGASIEAMDMATTTHIAMKDGVSLAATEESCTQSYTLQRTSSLLSSCWLYLLDISFHSIGASLL